MSIGKDIIIIEDKVSICVFVFIIVLRYEFNWFIKMNKMFIGGNWSRIFSYFFEVFFIYVELFKRW